MPTTGTNSLLCPWYLTIGGEQELGSILLRQPSDLVDLFFNLQTLQVVKVWLVALECAVDIILPRVRRLPHLLWFSFRLKQQASAIQLKCGNLATALRALVGIQGVDLDDHFQMCDWRLTSVSL